jgi:predicted Zn-dependent protease
MPLLDAITADPKADAAILYTLAQINAQMGFVQKLETVLVRLVQLQPENPEAWYDLAAVQVVLGKSNEGLKNLDRALSLSARRLASQPGAKNLAAIVAQDPRFGAVKANPEFQKMIAPR